MKQGKLIGSDIEIVAEYLSDNLVYIRRIESDQREGVIFINDQAGEIMGFDHPKWNLKIEGKTHFVVTSMTLQEFKKANENLESIQ